MTVRLGSEADQLTVRLPFGSQTRTFLREVVRSIPGTSRAGPDGRRGGRSCGDRGRAAPGGARGPARGAGAASVRGPGAASLLAAAGGCGSAGTELPAPPRCRRALPAGAGLPGPVPPGSAGRCSVTRCLLLFRLCQAHG